MRRNFGEWIVAAVRWPLQGCWGFDPHKSFFDLAAFRLTALIYAIAFHVMYIVIFFAEGLWWEWDGSAEGFKRWLEFFNVPFLFLASSVPVFVLFATHFRSVQAKESIAQTIKSVKASRKSLKQSELAREEAQRHNNFTNYFKSLSEFKDHISLFDVVISDVRKYHSIIFDSSLEGDFRVSDYFLKVCESFGKRVRTYAQKFQSSPGKVRAEGVVDIIECCRDLERQLGSIVAPKNSSSRVEDRSSLSVEVVMSKNRNLRSWLSTPRVYTSFLERSLGFFPIHLSNQEKRVSNLLAVLNVALLEAPEDPIHRVAGALDPYDFEAAIVRAEIALAIPCEGKLMEVANSGR